MGLGFKVLKRCPTKRCPTVIIQGLQYERVIKGHTRSCDYGSEEELALGLFGDPRDI